MPKVLLGLGSNMGDRLENLQRAVDALAKVVEIVEVAPVYETPPMYVLDQPKFCNSALAANTSHSPRELLRYLKQIEREVGRDEGFRYGPREIDIDLLAYGSLQYCFSDSGLGWLQIPHPMTAERRFVLAPLADIDPEILLPGFGRVGELLEGTVSQAQHMQRMHGELRI